jgi:hypothetical protein
MKTIKLLALTLVAFLGVAPATAQTADEIISKYVDAIGGKDQLAQISSLYMEGILDVMGNQGSIKLTTLNGKAFKQEIDVMGTVLVFCVTDSAGWSINPMAGTGSPEDMAPAQYKASKEQIHIAGPFVDFAGKGYSAELIGQETVGDVNANKLKVTSPDSLETFYFFDPETNYLVKSAQQSESMGQSMEITTIFSDYQKTETGYALPYKIEQDYGGQFFLVTTVNKVEVNQPVDPAFFAKP